MITEETLFKSPIANISLKLTSFNDLKLNDNFWTNINPQGNHKLKKASPHRKSEFIAGRFCAQQALKELKSKKLHVEIGEKRQPIWPEGFCGSITHKQNYAAAAVTYKSNFDSIGIDLEIYPTDKQVAALKKIVLSQNETLLGEKTKVEFNFFSIIIFSAKESIFKCLFPSVNQYFGFHAVEINSFNIKDQYLTYKTNRDLGDLKKGFEGKVHYLKTEDKILTISTFIAPLKIH